MPTNYRILKRETDDPERWRLANEVVHASNERHAVSLWIEENGDSDNDKDSGMYAAVPLRNWHEVPAVPNPTPRLKIG